MRIGRALLRLVDWVDGAAGVFLAIIAALTFCSVVVRYGFRTVIPDGFDVGRLLLGIAVFWGIAGTAYRADHIQVDVLWSALPPGPRRFLDGFASLLTLGSLSVFAWVMFRQVLSVQQSHQTTFDLQIPIWPFYGVAWAGIALAAVLTLVRIFYPPQSD
ncbi:MAG TPA: TRAP transporter small permease [Deferrisomatales bacterium]|nr:TRAP transporter small permease [Deferrisomatales bacterium]